MKKFFVFALVLMLVFISAPIFAVKAEAAALVAADLVVVPAVPSASSVEAAIFKELGGIKATLIFISFYIGAIGIAVGYIIYLIRERTVMATIKETPIKSEAIQREPRISTNRPPKDTPAPAAAAKKRPGRKPRSGATQ